MRKTLLSMIIMVFVLVMYAMPCPAQNHGKNSSCDTIIHGEVYYTPGHYLAGEPIPKGFDPFGYNYQAHLFNGYITNVYLGRYGYPPYDGDKGTYLAAHPGAEALIESILGGEWESELGDLWEMKIVMWWNDAWLSNCDCDHDGLLDRSSPYKGSGAWLTNHEFGSYQDEDGNICHWNYFIKIVAVPADATNVGGKWYSSDGIEIGEAIWGPFAIIMDVKNDPCGGFHGFGYISPYGVGFGKYGPQRP